MGLYFFLLRVEQLWCSTLVDFLKFSCLFQHMTSILFTSARSLFFFEDLTVALMSERPDDEVKFDFDRASAVNTDLFEDAQEWNLHDDIEWSVETMPRPCRMDAAKAVSHSLLWCKTQAARRPGFYVFSVFMMMVLQDKELNIDLILLVSIHILTFDIQATNRYRWRVIGRDTPS